ncbi:hypothetical protein M8494_22120 [Serratia ureilytica]
MEAMMARAAVRCCRRAFAMKATARRSDPSASGNLWRTASAATTRRVRMIAGHHSQEISEILGYEYGPVAVHATI